LTGVLLAAAACTPARPGPLPSRSPTTPSQSGAPKGLRVVADLRGYLVHALLPVAGGVELVGERLDARGGGVLLRYDAAAGAVRVAAELGEAAQLRAVASGGADTRIVGGIDRAGRGLVLTRTRGSEWRRVTLPPDVTEIDGVALATAAVVAVGSASDRAVVLAGTPADLTTRAVVAPAHGTFARLEAVTVAGTRVVAAGSDGRSAVVVESLDGGDRFRTRRVAGAALDAAGAAGANVFVGGWAGPTDDDRRTATLLRSAATGWRAVATPAAASVTALAFDASGRDGIAAVATGSVDALLLTRDGGASWARVALPSPSQPPTIEAVAIDESAAWAAGPSGLYRGPP
jgi:hypothetical protein